MSKAKETNETTAKAWTDERVDNLAALITVTNEQLEDRKRAERGLAADSARVRELVRTVFGDDTPSVQKYLESHDGLIAA